MSGFAGYPDENNSYRQGEYAGYGFQDPNSQFGQELNFQSFSTEQGRTQYGDTMYASNPYLSTTSGAAAYHGTIFTPTPMDTSSQQYSTGGDGFEDEPPLLEELGINPNHIVQKTLAVLNPFRSTEAEILQDIDLAGPLVFCLAFGGFLLLSGKPHFNYIYGISALGCLGVFTLLSLMSTNAVTFGVVVSVLGYCLLPMVALSGLNVVISLQGIIGLTVSCLAILWCSLSASKLFVTALSMERQQLLVAYPCALLYAVFALITVF